jgi:hypothetical protein
MRWAIEIQKTSLEDRMLSDLLRALNINLVQGINFPKALSSSEIDTCTTSQNAIEIARNVRSALKRIDPEFSLGAVIDFSVDPPTLHQFLEVDSCVINISTFFPATLTVSPAANLSPVELEQWTRNHEQQQYQAKLNDLLSTFIPAFSNPNAEKVLELLSIEPQTAVNLWKIYEYIRGKKEKDSDENVQKNMG